MKVVSIKAKVPVIENHKEETCGEDEIIVKLKACGIFASSILSFSIIELGFNICAISQSRFSTLAVLLWSSFDINIKLIYLLKN